MTSSNNYFLELTFREKFRDGRVLTTTSSAMFSTMNPLVGQMIPRVILEEFREAARNALRDMGVVNPQPILVFVNLLRK